MNHILITPNQVMAIRRLIEYSITQERADLEIFIFEEYHIDMSNKSDDDLSKFCVENSISHTWCDMYLISTI